jgi:hypothetical protein
MRLEVSLTLHRVLYNQGDSDTFRISDLQIFRPRIKDELNAHNINLKWLVPSRPILIPLLAAGRLSVPPYYHPNKRQFPPRCIIRLSPLP